MVIIMNSVLQKPLFRQNMIFDLYELTMAAGYFCNNYNDEATFEVFVREMPENRNYLVAAGLQQVAEYLLDLKFDSDELTYLKQLKVFQNVPAGFWEYLSNFRFNGDMWAIPEGEIVFPGEPLIRITAPIIEAQLVETFVLTMINYQTMIASKAARVVYAAQLNGKKRDVLEFGSRRAHGPEAGLLAARASYIAGCTGTSNVLAGMRFNIPVYGTAAHSWTLAFSNELEAFQNYYKTFPESTILLIDTYSIEQGVRNAIKTGPMIRGVRIDSGDLLDESKKVRQILDDAGMDHVNIVASGDLNEYKIARLVQNGAPIDSFGVGTQMVTSADAPSLGGIYKLVEQKIKGKIRYRAKFSPKKITYPGKKQVFRFLGKDDNYISDTIGLESEEIKKRHKKLLVPVIEKGEVVYDFPEISQIRENFFKNFERLDTRYKAIDRKEIYPVHYSDAIQKLLNDLQTSETKVETV